MPRDALAQDNGNSIVNALELLQRCDKSLRSIEVKLFPWDSYW